MERIFWVKNGDLENINNWLQKGGRVKSVHPIAEPITAYGYSGSGGSYDSADHGQYVGDIYAYIVVEFD